MPISYDDIFKYSDRLNPISSRTLFLAGKLAKLNSKKIVLDLGSGKGYPSLLWASMFGVNVEGFDLNKNYIDYANSHARLLNLSNKVKFNFKDVRELSFDHNYDVISSLGLGVVWVYEAIDTAFINFKKMLKNNGILIFGEPIWLVKPVPKHIQEILNSPEKNLKTKPEIEHLLNKHNFRVLGSYVSSKEDWECYIRPINIAMLEITESQPELALECKKVIDGFGAEYQAVKRYWDMILWVARAN